MAVLTKERFSELIAKLRTAHDELDAKDPSVSSTLAKGAEEIERLLVADDLDAAERAAKALWADLLEFPVIRSVFPTMAPGDAPDVAEMGLEQTAEAIDIFNEVVREIGTLPR